MEQMFAIPDGYFTTLAFDEGGRAYVGTGSEGRVYACLARSHGRAGDRRPGAAGAGAAARRQRLPGRHRRRRRRLPRRARGGEPGDATCRACSTASTARAGACSAGTARTTSAIESRSGNTAKPDTTWTGFAALEHPRPTAEGGVGQVASPPARYVQYRATFGAPDGAAGGGDARLPAPEPARAHHRARRRGQRRRRPRSGRWGRWRPARPRRRRRARTRPCSSCAGRSRTPTATSSTTGSPSARRTTPCGARWAAPIR